MKTIRLLMTLMVSVFFMPYVNGQSEQVIYTPKLPQATLSNAKSNLEQALNLSLCLINDDNTLYKPKSISVFDNRFMLTFYSGIIVDFYFYELQNYKIEIIETLFKNNNWERQLKLGKLVFITKSGMDKESICHLAAWLYYFQQLNFKPLSNQLILFEPLAEKYRAMKIKPVITEEQRKYIVQANFFNQQKNYNKAIELYLKAIDVDQITYPEAYSNLALLSAQTLDFQAAIYYMKKYLLLVPDASDARSAQDKIYEWETKISK